MVLSEIGVSFARTNISALSQAQVKVCLFFLFLVRSPVGTVSKVYFGSNSDRLFCPGEVVMPRNNCIPCKDTSVRQLCAVL